VKCFVIKLAGKTAEKRECLYYLKAIVLPLIGKGESMEQNDHNNRQRAFLVALELPGTSRKEVEVSLEELAGLVDTAGGVVVGRDIQKRKSPSGSLLIGKGKALELEERRRNGEFDIVVFNHDLTPSQQRNLENIIQCAIIDRTTLILDIFAQRAKTREAKLQVELAQLQYRLTRLTGKGVELSRLGGGIGTRGPGLTKLEVDRRRIRDRIAFISRELQKIGRHRHLIRKQRISGHIPVVALTGYTNVGKSTLHRALAGSDAYADNRLFATLDASARRVEPAYGEPYVLIDTVGFIRDLPPKLVAAFHSTLEEVKYSNIILHVVDSTSRNMDQEIRTVEKALGELEVLDKPRIMVFNKIDLLDEDMPAFTYEYPDSIAVSAVKGTGLEELNAAIQVEISKFREKVEFLIPYDKLGLLDMIYSDGTVLKQESREGGIYIKAILNKPVIVRVNRELDSSGNNK